MAATVNTCSPTVGIGDISFVRNSEELAESFEGWTSNSYPTVTPRYLMMYSMETSWND